MTEPDRFAEGQKVKWNWGSGDAYGKVSDRFAKGQKVKWNWGSGDAYGKVSDRFERRVQRTVKGTKVVRNGSKDNPAYLIEQDDGDKVLKLGSELEKA